MALGRRPICPGRVSQPRPSLGPWRLLRHSAPAAHPRADEDDLVGLLLVATIITAQTSAPAVVDDPPPAEPAPATPDGTIPDGSSPGSTILDDDTPSPTPSPLVVKPAPLSPAPVPAAAPVAPVALSDTTAATEPFDFFADDQLGHYLAWYGAEYVAVSVLAAGYLSGFHKQFRPAPALIGPQFDLERPDLTALMDPRLDTVIGKPLLKEQVPTTALIIGSLTSIAALSATDLAVTGDLHRTHNLILGGAEVVVGAVALTEVMKLSFGRLRPDFRQRYLVAACTEVVKAPDGLDCSTVDTSVAVDEEALLDGMKSFPSGHSSNAFALATFGAMYLGTNLIVSDQRPDWGPAVGALGIGALAMGATYVAGTRLSDNRHHVEDVVVGASLGAAVGASIYFVHFDVDGRARRRRWTVQPMTAMGATGTGQGVAVAGVF